jgi:hypothetical protein
MRSLLILIFLLPLGGCMYMPQQLAKAWQDIEVWHDGQNITPIPENQKQQTWCYDTIGKPDCYTTPQDVPRDRFIGVQPDELRPLTPDEYNDRMRPNAAPIVPVVREPMVIE